MAKNGNIRAQSRLAYLYEHGLGVARNYKEALKWYRKAAKCGHPYAQYNLAVMYESGGGVALNCKKAAE
ncbi:MAG: sel1 repeat family protein [Desulfovibrio sp.]|nr:sel1 repeat family protein [Desulfovibrio sp.]